MKNNLGKSLPSAAAALLLSMLLFQPALAAEQAQMGNAATPQKLSLKTATAEEGFALAVVLARKGVTTTQKNKEVLHALRPGYANNADSLIAVSHVIAVHFQTVAAANNYWRD
jgi:hypothetical protein